MRYEPAPDIQLKAEEISKILFPHVDVTRLKCFRSYGSSSRGTIARCHALGKLLQEAIGIRAIYALEFISERFDRLDKEEQLKIIIHELMHIPKTFGGGFRQHDFVCEENINLNYRTYKAKTMVEKGKEEKLRQTDVRMPSVSMVKAEENEKEKNFKSWFKI
jgi:predicted metallopeptidase